MLKINLTNVLFSRMIIFSNSSILACPDTKDVQQVHIIFNKNGDDYDKINSMFSKYSLTQVCIHFIM